VPSSGYVLLSAKHPAKHPPTTQAVAVGRLQSPLAISAPPFMHQLSPKEEEETYIKYSSNTSVLFAEGQNSPHRQKTFRLSAERLLPFPPTLNLPAGRQGFGGQAGFALL